MRLDTVHHIAIITKDYDQTIDFYVNKLGFKIIRENKREDKQDIKLVESFVVQSYNEFENYGSFKFSNGGMQHDSKDSNCG